MTGEFYRKFGKQTLRHFLRNDLTAVEENCSTRVKPSVCRAVLAVTAPGG
jgi:hypothetical protein